MAWQPTRAQLRKNLKALRARLDERPMDLDARMRMARTHGLLGEPRQAINHYRSVARYLSLSGQPLGAIAVLKELLLVDPSHEETLLFLAKLYARTRSADATNTGRVAVPILEDDTGPLALPEGLPSTATGLWRAIRPQRTDLFTVVHSPEEVGAEDDDEISIAEELREFDEAFELDDGDVIEERAIDDDDIPGTHRDTPPPSAEDVPLDSLEGTEGGEETAVLPRVAFLSSLAPEAFVELGHAMVYLRARAGDVLFAEGDEGDSCLVISRGQAVAVHHETNSEGEEEEVVLKELGPGDFAGVFGLVVDLPRQATLKATSDLEYFEIDRLAIRELIDKHPAAEDALATFFRERLLLNLLGSLPVFSNLTTEQREATAASFKVKTFDVGDTLLDEGSDRDGLWVLLSGDVAVRQGDQVLRTLRVGEYVGSLARTREATTAVKAVATGYVEAAVLPHAPLNALLSKHPDLAEVEQVFADRSMMLDDVTFAGGLTSLGATHA
jgi:CRP-like cAMP-binding protein